MSANKQCAEWSYVNAPIEAGSVATKELRR